MHLRILIILCSLLLVPLGASADSGGGNGDSRSDNPWNKQVDPQRVTADYDAKVPNGPETIQRYVTQMYAELKATR